MPAAMRKLFAPLVCLAALALGACTGGYSFTGASIPPGAKTISVATFPNYAPTVNPQLSQKLTDELMQMFSSQTSLSVTTAEGDLQLSGEIVGYDTRASALSSSDEVSMNRLTVTVKVRFVNQIDPDADFEPLRPYVIKYTRYVLDHSLPKGVCLNINFPNTTSYKGVRVCRMAQGSWCNELTTCHHPRGYDYHWMVGYYQNDEPEADDTDNWALTHGYVAITPTTFDVTAHDCLNMTFE